MRQFGGTTSEGEFASMLEEIFEPETHTEFSWDHWGKLRGRKTYVFAYDVQQEFSHYHVEADDKLSIVPAYRGLVYIDEDTKMVVKIVMTPYDMPSHFPDPRHHHVARLRLRDHRRRAVHVAAEVGPDVQAGPSDDEERHRVPAVSQVRNRIHDQVRDAGCAA